MFSNNITKNEKPKIMLIDDDDVILMALEEILSISIEIEFESYTDPSEALSRLKEARFSLIITDFMMPGIRGDEIRKSAREIQPDIPVLIMSGYDPETSDELKKVITKECFIKKPFDDIENLANLVISHL